MNQMKRKNAIRTFLITMASVCVVAFFAAGSYLYWLTGPGYYAEMDEVRARLEAIPEVRILELDGVEDLTLENIRARIHIEGKGEMELYNLDRNSFRNTRHLDLHRIGPHSLRIEGEGFVGVVQSATGKEVRSQFYGGIADIGPDGEFAHMFPFEINNVQTAVSRYDEILTIIRSWPVAPAKQHFRDTEGTDFYFSIKTMETAEQAQAPAPAGEKDRQ